MLHYSPTHSAPSVRQALPHRFRALASLTLLGHLALIGLASELLRRAPPLPPSEKADGFEVLFVEPEAPAPTRGEDGGGSLEPGHKDVASGTAKRAPQRPEPQSVIAKNPEQLPSQQPKLQETKTEAIPPVDLPEPPDPGDVFAMDDLLTSETGASETPTRVKLVAARTRTLGVHTIAAAMPGTKAAFSRFRGTGPGTGGGRGGAGRRRADNAFGGSAGAFTGHLCLIPEYTPSLHSLGTCESKLTLHTDTFNVSPRDFKRGFPGLNNRDEWFAILYTGQFETKSKGKHSFRIVSDDGSILKIDGQVVVDHDGQHGPSPRRGQVHLDAGVHNFQLRYFQGPGAYIALQVFVTPPNQFEQLFSKSF